MWILADAFETDERFLKPGTKAMISHPALDTDLEAVVSHVLPEFSSATRTLKVRLEVKNPGFRLRPGMFVDVSVPGQGKATSGELYSRIYPVGWVDETVIPATRAIVKVELTSGFSNSECAA